MGDDHVYEALIGEIAKVTGDMSMLQEEFRLYKQATQEELTQFINSSSEQDAAFAQAV